MSTIVTTEDALQRLLAEVLDAHAKMLTTEQCAAKLQIPLERFRRMAKADKKLDGLALKLGDGPQPELRWDWLEVKRYLRGRR